MRFDVRNREMKIIGLVPVRNEAWILPHSLASLSAFCDVVIVSDQNSEDQSREICRRFPKVVLLESAESRISTQVRWQLFDAARGYDGCNLLWCTDADELVAPRRGPGLLHRAKRRSEAGNRHRDARTSTCGTAPPGTASTTGGTVRT